LEVRHRAKMREKRLKQRTRTFSRKKARKISAMASHAKYCWTRFFSTSFDTHYIPWAYGPQIPRKTFDYLLINHQNYSSFLRSKDLMLRAGHVYTTINPTFAGTLDTSVLVGNPQTTIDVAASVNAATLGTPYAGEIFRESVKNSLVVNTAVTPRQRKIIESEISVPVIFKNIKPVASDHAVVAAFRELTRQIYETCFKINRTKIPTLAVGSTSQEFTKYGANPYIDYHFHGGEAKDYDRLVRWFLQSFVENLAKKAGHGSKLTQRSGESCNQVRYDSFKKMLEDYKTLMKIPDKLKLGLCPKYEQLLLEDSFYNLREVDYKELFKVTKANFAVGYGLLPLELIFPDLPQNANYRITREGSKAHLNFSYTNGYCHDERAWSTLLRSPVMRFSEFALITELVSFVGPMSAFKITKVVESGETISRTLALPEHKQFVRILDVLASTDLEGRVSRLSYFSVFSSEYFEALNYCLSIDPKSLTLHNTMTFVRRRAGGVSLISKELLAPWHIKTRDFHAFSLAVYLVAKMTVDRTDLVSPLHSSFTKTVSLWSTLGGAVSIPFSAIFSHIKRNELAGKLVLFPNNHLKQREQIIVSNPTAIEYELRLDEVYEEKFFSCPICQRLDGKLGSQVIKCEHKNHSVTISMSDNDVKVMEAKLADDDKDPPGLREVKKRAKQAMPKTSFEHTARFHYILGGPGCGKSYIIKQLATQFDLIYAPFTKLMSDYRGLVDNWGERYDLHFATVHRGLESRGVSTIFIDEFTSLPMEYIKMVIAVNKAEDIFIVGDTKQSRVRTEEGTYIGDVLEIEDLPRHTLMRNFRNPVDTVALLNEVFSYEMEAMSDIKKSIYVLGPNELLPEDLKDKPFNKFTFSYASLPRYSLDTDSTVRKYQGSTVDYAMLFVDTDTGEDTSGPNLSAVALSRHRKALVVKHDGSQKALAWLTTNHLNGEVPTECTVKHDQLPNTAPLDFKAKETEQFIKTVFVTSALPEKAANSVAEVAFFSRDRLNLFYSVFSTFRLTFFSRVFWFYFLLYVSFDFASALTGRTVFSEAVLKIVFVTCRLLMLKTAYVVVAGLGPNSDVHVLFFHLACSFFFFGHTKLLHYCVPFIPAILSSASISGFLVLPYFAAKMLYLVRIFSLESFRYSKRLAIIFSSAVILMPLMWPLGNMHFCDVLSRPYVILLVLLMRLKNFRFSINYPFYSYDPNHTLLLPSYEYYVNAVHAGFSGGPEYIEYMTHYLPAMPILLTKLKPALETILKQPIEQAPKDSHLLAKELMPSVASEELIDYHNNVGSTEVEDDYYTGVVSPDFLNPLSVKHRPKNTLSKFFQIMPGTGNVFNKKSLPQLLQVMGARYFNKKPKALRPFDRNAEILAEKIVDSFFAECMGDVCINEEDIAVVSGEFVTSAAQKKYENSFKGFDNFDAKTIRFHLKDIFKPKISSIADPQKPGQGISAWSKDSQVMFGIGARLANYLLCKCTKQNVVYDNRMSVEDMKEKVISLMTTLPKVSKNGITDFTMFDSQQDLFTQHIERVFMDRLGFSSEFIEHYYAFRTNYKIIGESVAGTSRYEKTSGEPMTLLMNTIISGCLSNYFLRGEGPFMLAMKGDDGFKRQCNLFLDRERYAEVSQFTCLRMKVEISDEAEFCGFVIVNDLFVDSIPRKLHKLLSHHFTSYSHFCLYQQSLRDFVKHFEDNFFFGSYLAANVQMYEKQGSNYEEMLAMYNVIKSFSHIGEEQFYDSVCFVTYDNIYKTSTGPLIQYFDRQAGNIWKKANPNMISVHQ
jgi:hypothetical protein